MKRIFALSLLVLLVLSCSEEREPSFWPDGTRVERWFGKPSKVKEGHSFLITDYGASPNSDSLQTACIQSAIDAAFNSGGGTVVVPRGTFRTSSLFFKEGTRLRLEEGAVLKGSNRIADYPVSTVHIEGVLQEYVSALINAYGVDGFSITGKGTVDGNGLEFWKAFWARREENPDCTNLEVRRPRMIYVCDSRDVLIEGVKLQNPGFWTTHLYKCKRVRIKDVEIKAPVRGIKAPSSDAIDIDGCSMVHVTGCDISVDDDFIALKGGKGPYADIDPDNAPDEKILIENCRFGEGPQALTLGSECIDASNIIMRDCHVSKTRKLLRLKVRPDTPQNYRGILLEGITGYAGTLIHVHPYTQFFDLKDRKDPPMTYISGVTLRNSKVNCSCRTDIQIDSATTRMEDPVLEDNIIFMINYDENEVGEYSLEDPLEFADLTPVGTRDRWPGRRQEILEIFQREMYGRMPSACPFWCDTLETGSTLGGFATRLQLRMWFDEARTGPKIDWIVIVPKDVPGPVPSIIALNYEGNHTLLPDEEILIPDCWLDGRRNVVDNRATAANRGSMANPCNRSTFPLGTIISRGYAFVSACYGDVSPDPDDVCLQKEIGRTGVFDLWREQDASAPDATAALMAWGWALCRGMDMIETIPELDPGKVVVTGSSRLGKAALIAGAFDERFSVVAPNQTGGGGVPLAKRNFGETIRSETESFTHWYCKAYSNYADNEQAMPFDQHLLLSCIAPRPLLIMGFDDPWYDTRGEFLALKAASKVWTFLGREGLPDVDWPESYRLDAVGKTLGYVRRTHKHGLSSLDWQWILDFSDRNLK